jgi:hypothetical protein
MAGERHGRSMGTACCAWIGLKCLWFCLLLWAVRKGRCALSVTLSDFTVWRHTWQKNQVHRAVLTGNSADLRTVLSSRLSHREPLSSLRESHSFLCLPADTTMASSQGTKPSRMNKREATRAFIETYRSSPECTRRRTKKKKLTNLMGNLCCAREHSVQFFVQFFLHSLTVSVWGP